MRRILGNGDLWITELVLTYDDLPSYTVSIMQFRDGKVASETQYFCDPFKPGPSRAHLVELVRGIGAKRSVRRPSLWHQRRRVARSACLAFAESG